MKTNQIKFLRGMVVIMLAVLVIQYELGMVVNLSPDLPKLPAPGLSLSNLSDALHLAGSTAQAHAALGSFLTLLSVLTLVLSLRSKNRSVKTFGSLGFLTILLAMTGGVLFTVSGFQEDHYSLAMASNFILAVVFYFLELYFLKSGSQAESR